MQIEYNAELYLHYVKKIIYMSGFECLLQYKKFDTSISFNSFDVR